MLISATCPSCGRIGVVEDSSGTTCPCPACGTRLSVEELVASWVAPAPGSVSGPSRAEDDTCSSCGYTGPMAGEGLVCPACAAVQPGREAADHRRPLHRVKCPECGDAIAMNEEDRGRTIICPSCKHFLGCMIRDERPRPWRRRGPRKSSPSRRLSWPWSSVARDATLAHREPSVPLRAGDLTRLLLAEPGLSDHDRAQLGLLGQKLGAVFHLEFYSRLQQLKDLYAPLDPDNECVVLDAHSRPRTDSVDEAFLERFEVALERANYRPMSLRALEEAVRSPNGLGLRYVPNFEMFEHLKVWVRGRDQISREARTLGTLFRRRLRIYEGYRRMVVALKFRDDEDLGPYARSDVLYLRLFKDVPSTDLEMHLPEQGTRIRMRLWDKAQIASPVVFGVPTAAAKLLFAGLTLSPLIVGSVLFGTLSAGVKSFFGFRQAKIRHLLLTLRHLYYLTLAHNGSVITTIVHAAEQEEYKEALLAYFFLHHHRDRDPPWTEARLDAWIETYLRQQANLQIDFEIHDAMGKLLRLGLAQRDSDGRLSVLPPEQALARLDEHAQNQFQTFNPK